MKLRARRVTIAAAVLGGGVIASLVVVHWGTIRDHVEVWHFQLTRETEMIVPHPALRGEPVDFAAFLETSPGIGPNEAPSDINIGGVEPIGHWYGYEIGTVLRAAANYSGHPWIFSTEDKRLARWADHWVESGKKTADIARKALEATGWRVLEQRFPRRAYVIVREAQAQQVTVEALPPYIEHG